MIKIPAGLQQYLRTVSDNRPQHSKSTELNPTPKYLKFKKRQISRMNSDRALEAEETKLTNVDNSIMFQAGFHKRAYSNLNKAARNKWRSPKTQHSTPRSKVNIEFPLPPFEAAHVFHDRLSQFELEEILQFSQIYYIGIQVSHTFPLKQGHYPFVKGDHLCYRYEILEKIGKGAFSQVFKCYDHRRKEQIAIKILRNDTRHMSDEGNILNCIQDEERSKYIISMISVMEFRKFQCYVFELLNANLYDTIKTGRISNIGHLKKVTFRLLKALECIHQREIIHADIKPENVGVKHLSKLNVKLIDFGSAHKVGAEGFNYIQSRYYRAPEVILGSECGVEIDIWSLGCLLVEIATGMVLFPGYSEYEMIEYFMWRIGEPGERLLEKCTRKDKFFYQGELIRFKGVPRASLGNVLNGLDKDFADLVQKMIRWDCRERITARDALKHRWINNSLRLKWKGIRPHF